RTSKMDPRLTLAALPERERREAIAEFIAVLDRHPDLAHMRAVARTGSRSEPVIRPTARELFTTAFSSVTTEAIGDLLASEPNYSPAPQVLGSGGELIVPE